MANPKVSVIGAGNVGATCAQRILDANLADVVLVDIVEGLAQGKALDMAQAGILDGYRCRIEGTTDYSKIQGSDIVIITAGLPRKPGMKRSDLIEKNKEIIKSIVEKVKEFAENSIIIMVTNPLDSMTYLAYKASGFDKKKILGMAGVLDTTRLRYFMSQKTGMPASEVEALVLGGHADTMVPLSSLSMISGKCLDKFLMDSEIKELLERTRNGGAEIVSLLKQGGAFYAPASSVKWMVHSILKDTKTVMPVSVYLEGEYGIKDLCLGVPVKLGKLGAEEIVDLDLNNDERKMLLRSAEKTKEEIDLLNL